MRLLAYRLGCARWGSPSTALAWRRRGTITHISVGLCPLGFPFVSFGLVWCEHIGWAVPDGVSRRQLGPGGRFAQSRFVFLVARLGRVRPSFLRSRDPGWRSSVPGKGGYFLCQPKSSGLARKRDLSRGGRGFCAQTVELIFCFLYLNLFLYF